MNDLISREALIEDIGKSVEPFTVSMIYRHINNAPAVDAVPVVRCKDCVYFGLDKENADLDNWYHFCQNLSCGVKKMDYCSFGERRE